MTHRRTNARVAAALLAALALGICNQAHAATSLDGGAGQPDLRLDARTGCWFLDADADGAKEDGEVCVEDESIRFARDFAEGSATGGINEAIADCGRNGSGGGCHVWMPPGEVQIDEPIQMGGLSGYDQQYGITLHGHGSGVVDTQGEQRCGTILRPGPGFDNGSPMMAVEGSVWWRLQDFCIDGAWNGRYAGWGIRIRGDNSPEGCCANNGHGSIEFVSIRRILRPPGIGIAIAGNNEDSRPGLYPSDDHDDQVDFVTITHTSVRDSLECFRQDSRQSASNHLRLFQCSNWGGRYGIVVLLGRLVFEDVYLGPKRPKQVGIRWEHGAARMEANNLVFEWGGDEGIFVQFAGPPGTVGNQDVHTIRGSRFQSQSPASTRHVFVEFGRRGTLNLIGNRFFAGRGAAMGEFDLDAPDDAVPTYVNFVGNEYMCTANGLDCSPTLNVSSSGGGEFPTGGIRVTRQEEGVFRAYDESGSIGPATTYRFYGKDLSAADLGKCLRIDQLAAAEPCGPNQSVTTTAVLAPSRARVGALTCGGPMRGMGLLGLAVRFRDATEHVDSAVALGRPVKTSPATPSRVDIDQVSPYDGGLISVVLSTVLFRASGDLVCQLEVFH